MEHMQLFPLKFLALNHKLYVRYLLRVLACKLVDCDSLWYIAYPVFIVFLLTWWIIDNITETYGLLLG